MTNINSNKNKFIHENIEAKIETHTSLNDGKDYDAFRLKVNEPLESGYSGSPLFDASTHHIIGVVSIKEGEEYGYAIDIKYVKEFVDLNIDVSKLEDNMQKEYHEEVARVVFEHKEADNYKIRINQTELFDGESVDIFEKREELISLINNYCYCLSCGTERDDNIKRVELIIPHQLFCEDIGLWEDSDADTLVGNANVLIRNILKADASSKKKQKNKDLWDITVNSTDTFEKLSVKVSGKGFLPVEDLLSTYLDKKSEEYTPFKKIALNSNIIVWINSCDDNEKYQEFLEIIFEEDLNGFPLKFRTLLSKSTDSCASNANLMWDNPNTLPKAYYE